MTAPPFAPRRGSALSLAVLFALLLAATPAQAGTLSVDTTGFPQVKVKFQADAAVANRLTLAIDSTQVAAYD